MNRDIILRQLKRAIKPIARWQQQQGSSWARRYRRGIWFPLKSIFYAVSKLFPMTIKTKTFFGETIYCHLPEHFYFYFFGFFLNDTTEAGLTAYLIKNLPEGSIMFDIGANCGLYTLLGSVLIKERGKIHAFEPTKEIYTLLQKSTAHKENVICNNTALANHTGKSIFYIDKRYSVANSIERTSNHQVESHTVLETLDAYCARNTITPDFLKIDAEGSELKIIQGGMNILSRFHPTIAMEILKDVEEEGIDAVRILVGLEYQVFRIEDDGSLARLSMEDLQSSDIYRGEGFINVLFKINNKMNN